MQIIVHVAAMLNEEAAVKIPDVVFQSDDEDRDIKLLAVTEDATLKFTVLVTEENSPNFHTK